MKETTKEILKFDYKDLIGYSLGVISIGLSFKAFSFWSAVFVTILIVIVIFSILCFIKYVQRKKDPIFQFFRLGNVSGVTRFYGERSELDWEAFYKRHRSPEEVVFMGQSLGKAFADSQIARFSDWCNSGASFRILLLSPSNTYSQQLRFVSEGMIEAPATTQPQAILKEKILLTVNQIEDRFISKVKGEQGQEPYLRFSTVDLPFSMIMIDDEMAVTLYTTEAEADRLPTFIIKRKRSPAFMSFKKEFETVWEKHSVINPYTNAILKEGLRHWGQYLNLKKSYYAKTPVANIPKQAILFPTYKCSNSCGFCMYKDKKGNVSMKATDFRKVVAQLIESGITRIELSGGGEPLESPDLDGILTVIRQMRSDHPKVRFGLLTNGIFLEKTFRKHKDLLHLFNDYIRVSRLIEDDIDEKNSAFQKKYQHWLKGVKMLLQKKEENNDKGNATKIGIKYLLSSQNKGSFVEVVKNDLDSFLCEFDHARFKSERTVSSDDIYPIEQQIYRLLRYSEKMKSGFETKVALSLPNIYYPQNFKCWISPIHVVIDPKGDTYICCNYVLDPAKAKIGNVLRESFKDIWGSERHVEARHNLSKEICSCSNRCSNCRFAELQFGYEHIISTLGYDYTG